MGTIVGRRLQTPGGRWLPLGGSHTTGEQGETGLIENILENHRANEAGNSLAAGAGASSGTEKWIAAAAPENWLIAIVGQHASFPAELLYAIALKTVPK